MAPFSTVGALYCVERIRITGFELNTLKSSSAGSTRTRPTAKVFETLRSSWLMRSVYSPSPPYGLRRTVRLLAESVPWSVGSTRWFAAHGATPFGHPGQYGTPL